MTSFNFCKFHGFGNDYIVIERSAVPDRFALPELPPAICHRNTGVGSDGTAVIEKLPDDNEVEYLKQKTGVLDIPMAQQLHWEMAPGMVGQGDLPAEDFFVQSQKIKMYTAKKN